MIDRIKEIYKNDSDFILRVIPNYDGNIYVLFFESLCSSKAIYDYIIKNIYENINLNNKIIDLTYVISSPKLIKIDYDSINYYLENGFGVIILNSDIYTIEAKASIDRGVNLSTTEPSMYGAKDSFMENYQKNLGLIKRRIKSEKLMIESFDLGNRTKTRISLIGFKDDEIKYYKKILQNKNDNIIDSSDILRYLDSNKFMPSILRSEKPSTVSKYILKNYTVLIMDNSPFALILDAKLIDFINPSEVNIFTKILRLICFIMTILTPAVYISLTCFNIETIPTSLLINFMKQRLEVPFPAIIEALIMLFVCELLREADLRFPNTYGSAASILGALILGDAAVNAGIVSPIMIIIIAITFITNLLFTEVKFVWFIRLIRLLFLIIASLFGLFGVGVLTILTLGLLADKPTFKENYL